MKKVLKKREEERESKNVVLYCISVLKLLIYLKLCQGG